MSQVTPLTREELRLAAECSTHFVSDNEPSTTMILLMDVLCGSSPSSPQVRVSDAGVVSEPRPALAPPVIHVESDEAYGAPVDRDRMHRLLDDFRRRRRGGGGPESN